MSEPRKFVLTQKTVVGFSVGVFILLGGLIFGSGAWMAKVDQNQTNTNQTLTQIKQSLQTNLSRLQNRIELNKDRNALFELQLQQIRLGLRVLEQKMSNLEGKQND